MRRARLLVSRAKPMASHAELGGKRRWTGRGSRPDNSFVPPQRDSGHVHTASSDKRYRIAVLGRTLSSLFFVRELQERLSKKDIPVEIALFPAMFDPARNIYTPHAICEFSSSKFWVTAGLLGRENEQLCALEATFTDKYLRPWQKQGRVTESAADGYGSPPSFSAKKGGMFQLLLDMEQELLGDDVVCHDSLQLTQMWYDEAARKWSLYSEFVKGSKQGDWYSAHQVPDSSTFYDHVIMGFDLDPRGARKASYKQMLESALPATCSVIRCLASTPCASAMTCVVEFEGDNPDVQADTCLYGPELDKGGVLEVAERLEPESHAAGRGLRFGRSAVWNLTASIKWSKSVRSSFNGGWDKRKVEANLVEAFRELPQAKQYGRYKGLVPCFHWQGAWPLSALDHQKPSCIYDAACKLGYASDAFVFLNAGASTSTVRQLRACNLLHPFKSARDLAELVAQDLEEQSPEPSRLPSRAEFKFRSELLSGSRQLQEDYADCGRSDPQDGLDHTWPTAVQLARDDSLVIHQADSLKKYRKR